MFHEHGDLRERTREFARRVAKVFRALPPWDRVAQVWGKQLPRAGGSVGANYREAQRARADSEYRSKLGDSLREAAEFLYWMELLELEGFISPERLAALKDEADQLIAIFVTLVRKGRERSQSYLFNRTPFTH
ncbi:MAG: four helix bundle protein [Verrucomicrobia bacterium]|nr:four helix bundle protein [Verrucomicrobiota bacterium]